jgi:porin
MLTTGVHRSGGAESCIGDHQAGVRRPCQGRLLSGSSRLRLLAVLLPALLAPELALAQAGTGEAKNAEQRRFEELNAAEKEKRYRDLQWKGLNIGMPMPSDTVLGGDTGLRPWLADRGIGLNAYWQIQAGDNINDDASRSGPDGAQQYYGQKFTWLSSLNIAATFDLSRHGIPDGQIVLGANKVNTSWEPGGPSSTGITTISYYQTFLDRRVELKLGYLGNNFEYYGQYVGGSLASSIFGSSSTGPSQAGLSHTMKPRPGLNLKANAGNFYNKFGVQKSTSPDGYVQEKKDNPGRLSWTVENAHTLFIDEIGYQRPAKPGAPQTWVRAGYIHNSSEFRDYRDGGRKRGDDVFYALADRQLLQFDQNAAARGLYGGFSYQHGTERLSVVTSTFEGRLYTIGAFNGRPRDMFSLVITKNVFSDDVVDSARAAGRLVHEDSTTATLAYSGYIAPGIRGGFGIGYTNHPVRVYAPDTGRALNALANLTFYF